MSTSPLATASCGSNRELFHAGYTEAMNPKNKATKIPNKPLPKAELQVIYIFSHLSRIIAY
ncbi:hypothetical protein [Desulfitobacterium hafniense]|uniref:hypothetical protein n=1 Tax=Desulfitobacterium hafniense TaxID=49338 RepID=UPI000372FCFF|nr:hypothetical protein [Desulfitobacterium hafniense]